MCSRIYHDGHAFFFGASNDFCKLFFVLFTQEMYHSSGLFTDSTNEVFTGYRLFAANSYEFATTDFNALMDVRMAIDQADYKFIFPSLGMWQLACFFYVRSCQTRRSGQLYTAGCATGDKGRGYANAVCQIFACFYEQVVQIDK